MTLDMAFNLRHSSETSTRGLVLVLGLLWIAAPGCDGSKSDATDDDSDGGSGMVDGSCTPGENFAAADGCNTCTCPSSGLVAEAGCTEIACASTTGTATDTGTGPGTSGGTTGGTGTGGDATGSTGGDPDSCVPGATFDDADGCNVCTCPDSGSKSQADCTDRACVECSSDDGCPTGQACNWGADNCGIFGIPGSCVPVQDICTTGGEPTCTCNGNVALNQCLAHTQRTDLMVYGGCELAAGSGTFLCGNIQCHQNSQYCSIQFNDVAGDEGPEYFAACLDLPAQCTAASCECVPVSPFGSCHLAGSQVMVFEPGGRR